MEPGGIEGEPMRDVIVVGAGVIGNSVAYRLTTGGVRVIVVDRAEPGTGTSANSFAWINANQKTPRDYFELNHAGMREHERIAAELGGAPWLHRTGNLVWTGDPERYDELCRRVERLHSWGYTVEWLTAGEVTRDLEPNLVFSGPTMRVAWFPEESWLNAPLYARSLLDKAVESGARIVSGHEVTAIDLSANQVCVYLENGQQLPADAVVNCAGPAADRIAGLVDRTLPLEPTRGLLVRVAGEPGLIRRVIHGPDVNMRPDGEGYLLLHHDSIDPLIGDRTEIATDDRLCRTLCKRARRVLPDISASRIIETRVGVRPYPADGVSCVGPVSGRPGYYEVVTHSGVSLGPLLGRLIAEEIIEGRVDPLLAPFRAERFG